MLPGVSVGSTGLADSAGAFGSVTGVTNFGWYFLDGEQYYCSPLIFLATNGMT